LTDLFYELFLQTNIIAIRHNQYNCKNNTSNYRKGGTTGLITRVPRRLPHVEQELLTLQEHLSSRLALVVFVLLDL